MAGLLVIGMSTKRSESWVLWEYKMGGAVPGHRRTQSCNTEAGRFTAARNSSVGAADSDCNGLAVVAMVTMVKVGEGDGVEQEGAVGCIRVLRPTVGAAEKVIYYCRRDAEGWF